MVLPNLNTGKAVISNTEEKTALKGIFARINKALL